MKKVIASIIVLCMLISLIPMAATAVADETNFETFKVSVSAVGSDGFGHKRIVVLGEDFPFAVTKADQLVGCLLNGTVTYNGSENYSASVPFENVVVEAQPLRGDGRVSLDFTMPEGYTLKEGDITGYTYNLSISPAPHIDETSFEPFKISVSRTGSPTSEIKRLLITNNLGFTPDSENQLAGCLLNGTVTYTGTDDYSKLVPFVNVPVAAQPLRTDGLIALDITAPEGYTISMNAADDTYYKWDLTLSPANQPAEVIDETNFTPFVISVSRTGAPSDGYKRLLVENDFGFTATENRLVGCFLNGTVTYSGEKDFSATIPFVNVPITAQPVRTDGLVALDFKVPGGYTISTVGADDGDYTWNLTISPEPDEVEVIGDATFYVTPDLFANNLGSWLIATDSSYTVLDSGSNRSEDAMTAIEIPATGKYNIYSYTKDFSFLISGTRYADISVNGIHLNLAGKHGGWGFAWEKIGEVELKHGEDAIITFHASTSANSSKTAALLFTTETMTPPTSNLTSIFDANKATAGKFQLSDSATSIYVPHTAFASDMGTWTLGSDSAGYLFGQQGTNVERQPATALIEVPEDGTYYVWGFAKDYTDNGQGSRYAHISVDDVQLENKIGQHGASENTGSSGSFGWTLAGSVELEKGQHTIGVEDTSNNFARVKGVFLTTDEIFNGFKQGDFSKAEQYTVNAISDIIDISTANALGNTVSYTLKNRTKKNYPSAAVHTVLYDGNNDIVWNNAISFPSFSANSSTEKTEFVVPSYINWSTGRLFIWESTASMRPLREPVSIVYKKDESVPDVDSSFPHYATEQNEATESYTIENDYQKIIFYKIPTSNGQVIQNEIYAKHNGEWIKTNGRDEPLGYVVIRADSASYSMENENCVIESNFTYDGKEYSADTKNPYTAGVPVWFVPTDYTANGNSVTLQFSDTNYGSMTATWSFDTEKQVKVSINTTFAEDGYYTVGASEGGTFNKSEVEYAVAPFRVQYKRIPDAPTLISEQYLFTPMGTYTLGANNRYAEKAVTKGVVLEPGWIPLRWVYDDNNLFGITMKNVENECEGVAFAPIMGSNESSFSAGDTYNLEVRIVNEVSDWFDAYESIVSDLYDVTDYRTNYRVSLNDAIFNTRELMLDDFYSGWDANSKAHYNMEMQNTTSSANSMQALQEYLLTEDEDILTNRAIPTLAHALTRKDLHFNNNSESLSAIGSPVLGLNTNTIGGMYEMTRGAVPYLYTYGLEKGTTNITNSYGSIAPFANDLAMYKYTGEQKYLDSAVQLADLYLEDVVYATSTAAPKWDSFIYISYYPNLANLLDIYEVTGQQKYLDAAEDVAQWMTTGLWVPGVDGTKKTDALLANDLDSYLEHTYFTANSPYYWKMGDTRYRVGRGYDLSDSTSDSIVRNAEKEVEGWLPSRVGLGVEQASTFFGSGHIIMQTFAGDFMKLSEYTGNDFYEKMARNAIVGRFNSYDGYYRQGYLTYPQEEDYPRVGPDYTGIYWHHIPPYLAMLEDFLINQTFNWSNKNIEFPSARQQGYAFFNSNQYGFAPGKFYDEDGMWLWLDEDVLTTDSIQIDWLAARKDGVLGIALMNEDAKDTTTVITLGVAVPNGSSYTGTATLYDANGACGTVEVVNGAFTVTVPAKQLMAVKVAVPGVTAPKYSALNYSETSANVGATVSTHTNGKGYVLQMSPDCYYAYVYVEDLPANISSLTMNYTIGNGETQTVSTSSYPFEFIVKVDDANAAFSYALTATKSDGSTESRGEGTLMTNAASLDNGYIDFEPFKLDYQYQGNDGAGGLRFVTNLSCIPVTPNAVNLVGLQVKGNVVDGNTTVPFETEVVGYEPRNDSQCVLVIRATEEIKKYQSTDNSEGSYVWDAYIYPRR